MKLIRTPYGVYINPDTLELVYRVCTNLHNYSWIQGPNCEFDSWYINGDHDSTKEFLQEWLDQVCKKCHEIIEL